MELNVSGNARLVVIATFFVYTAGMLLIGWLAKKNMDRVAINKYIDEFYTGGRGMGAIVVAMMIAAGLCSAGTFLGGPGLGYKLGATWVVVAGAQNFMTFIVLGEVGKKIGIVARRIGAQSIFGLLLHRYNRNKLIGIFGVVSIVCFMGSYVVAQIVGGARLFETMTGMSYELGLVLFSGVVLAVVAVVALVSFAAKVIGSLLFGAVGVVAGLAVLSALRPGR